MSGWQTFWICFCILLASPSTSAIAENVEAIAKQLKRIADALERRP